MPNSKIIKNAIMLLIIIASVILITFSGFYLFNNFKEGLTNATGNKPYNIDIATQLASNAIEQANLEYSDACKSNKNVQSGLNALDATGITNPVIAIFNDQCDWIWSDTYNAAANQYTSNVLPSYYCTDSNNSPIISESSCNSIDTSCSWKIGNTESTQLGVCVKNAFLSQYNAATSANPTATSANPTATSANPTATNANPTATSANPTATNANPTATSANTTATSANPTATSANPTALTNTSSLSNLQINANPPSVIATTAGTPSGYQNTCQFDSVPGLTSGDNSATAISLYFGNLLQNLLTIVKHDQTHNAIANAYNILTNSGNTAYSTNLVSSQSALNPQAGYPTMNYPGSSTTDLADYTAVNANINNPSSSYNTSNSQPCSGSYPLAYNCLSNDINF